MGKGAKSGDGLSVQRLDALKVEELTPLTPEVISRQATINIGTIGMGRTGARGGGRGARHRAGAGTSSAPPKCIGAVCAWSAAPRCSLHAAAMRRARAGKGGFEHWDQDAQAGGTAWRLARCP